LPPSYLQCRACGDKIYMMLCILDTNLYTRNCIDSQQYIPHQASADQP